MTWSWKTRTVEYKDRCSGCDKPLRSEPGPYVVYKGSDFHVGCLLDRLCADGRPASVGSAPEDALGWGLITGRLP